MQLQEIKKFIISRVDLMVLIICLVVTYGAWQIGIARDTTQQDALADLRVIVEHEMKVEMENLFHHINGVRGLYVSSVHVDPSELSDYMKTTSAGETLSPLLRIGYVQKVDSADVGAFEKELQSEGNVGYKVAPNPDYESQFYVAKTVDIRGNIYIPSGANLRNNEVTAKFIEKILASKQGQILYVPTVQNIEGYDGPSFIGSLPVVQNGKLIGLVNGIVSVEVVKKTIGELVGEDIAWKWSISDGTVLGEKGDLSGKQVKDIAIIQIFEGVNWKVEMSKPKKPTTNLNFIFGIGILISFMIYGMVYALSSANVRAQALAEVMTADLRKYKMALDAANNHIVITDQDGVVLYANKAAIMLTGFDLNEIIGKTPRLWGGQMEKSFYETFWKTIKNDKQVFSGIFVNKRKNGELYSAQSTVSPILGVSGELVGFVGVEVDVTKEKQTTKQQQETLEKLAKFNELMLGREMKMVELKKELERLKGQNV